MAGAHFPGHTSLQLPNIPAASPNGQAPEQPPVQAVPLSAPTQRPSEPITAGAPFGPGAGVEALGPDGAAAMGQPQDPVRQQAAALYRANPNPDVLRLIELLDAQGR